LSSWLHRGQDTLIVRARATTGLGGTSKSKISNVITGVMTIDMSEYKNRLCPRRVASQPTIRHVET
jgi:hypothetical protein